MANSAAKKIHKANRQRLRMLLIAILGVNAVYALARGLLLGMTVFHRVLWMVFGVLYVVPLAFLAHSARAQWDPVTGALAQAGHDLSAPGLLEYIHDALYVTLLTHFVCTFTRWGLAILALALAFTIYILASFALSALPSSSSSHPADQDPDAPEDLSALSRKDRRKAERKQARKQR